MAKSIERKVKIICTFYLVCLNYYRWKIMEKIVEIYPGGYNYFEN